MKNKGSGEEKNEFSRRCVKKGKGIGYVRKDGDFEGRKGIETREVRK